ncbi:MAG: sigma-70 family RNA polymerase sigma factor [Bacteroidota bacterium]
MTAADRIYMDDLVKREQGRLLGFIRSRVRSEEDARDILQDVYYQMTVGFNDIRSLASVTSWLFSVARNKITDHLKKKKPERLSGMMVRTGDDDGAPLLLEDILPSLTHSAEDEYMRGVIWETIGACLDRLPEEQRDVFVMNEFEEMSFKEISALTGVGINTLLSRKRYAVTYLREQLRELYTQMTEK